MDLLTTVRMSWRNVRGHTLRSTLTTLGIIIGVAAVITFVTLGASLQADIVRTVAGQNTDVIYVSATSGGGRDIPTLGAGGQPVFTEHDLRLLSRVEGVSAAIPQSGMAAASVGYRNDSVGRQLVTVTSPGYFTAKGLTFVEGGPFTLGEREVVLNRRAARMFQDNVTVGEEITIVRAANREELNATVVGIVREPAGGAGATQPFVGGGDQPAIYAPTRPYYERTVTSPASGLEERVYPQVLVVARDVTEVEAVRGRIQTVLAEESDARILLPQGYGIQVTTYDQLVSQIRQISDTFTAYIAGIAIISLIVGAIGIANIMLVNVSERRREIGIMKAVGGYNSDVLQLFLVEAILLGVLGSVIGAAVGLAGGVLATRLIGLILQFRPVWFLVSVVVGVLVGVGSGLYPAWRAARTDPIDALRYE